MQNIITQKKIDFDPRRISNLVAWFKADSLLNFNDNDVVGTWLDSSGKGNHATQTTAGNKPLYKTNIQNGKPIVRFDGVDDWMSLTNDPLGTGAQPMTVSVALKLTGSFTSYPEIIEIGTNPRPAESPYGYQILIGDNGTIYAANIGGNND